MSDDENESISAEMASMRERMSGLENGLKRLESAVSEAFNVMRAGHQINWPAISVALVVIGAFWYIITLQTSNSIGPVTTLLAVASKQQEENSGMIAALTKMLNEQEVNNKAEQAATNAKLTEVETQFRGEDQIENLHTANNQRLIALLWYKAYGFYFPEQTYYPQMAQPSK